VRLSDTQQPRTTGPQHRCRTHRRRAAACARVAQHNTRRGHQGGAPVRWDEQEVVPLKCRPGGLAGERPRCRAAGRGGEEVPVELYKRILARGCAHRAGVVHGPWCGATAAVPQRPDAPVRTVRNAHLRVHLPCTRLPPRLNACNMAGARSGLNTVRWCGGRDVEQAAATRTSAGGTSKIGGGWNSLCHQVRLHRGHVAEAAGGYVQVKEGGQRGACCISFEAALCVVLDDCADDLSVLTC